MSLAELPLVFCALDTPDLDTACAWAAEIGPVTGGLKLGLEFFNAQGPQGVERVIKACPDAALFLDLKFHDIPNTVAGAVRSICHHFAPMYLNVHCAGGMDMMRAAKNATGPHTKLLGVTILTSLSDDDIEKIGYTGGVQNRVMHLAQLAKDSGLDGVVCSSHEIKTLRDRLGGSWTLMVPGIRPQTHNSAQTPAQKSTQSPDDQKRVMTPQEAVKMGASHLVIGRPITQSPKPSEAAQSILDNLT